MDSTRCGSAIEDQGPDLGHRRTKTWKHGRVGSHKYFMEARLAALATTVALVAAIPQNPMPRAAVPVDPVTALIDAFDAYPVVALGEGDHGNEQSFAFRLALIRDPRFADHVN